MNTPQPSRTRRAAFYTMTLVAIGLGVLSFPGQWAEGGAADFDSLSNGTALGASSGPRADSILWGEVDRLISEQKYRSALDRIPDLREAARMAGDDSTWARALIEELELRIALHEHENAIQLLREQPWPEAPTERAAIGLHYANALVDYWNAYEWEIRKRERIAASTQGPISTWTSEQFMGEVHGAYAGIWAAREQWGDRTVGTLSPYVEANTYPPRIRGTMRDAITYFWVRLLARQYLWGPRHSNERYKLDVEELLGDLSGSTSVDLTDPEVHPLVKLCAILGELERWHASHGRAEAALEARLERLQALYGALSRRGSSRIAILQDLESTLDRFDPDLDWWSMGQLRLAELLREENSPDALIRARQAAQAGLTRHPNNVGGLRCAAMIEEIESSSYSLRAMLADGLAERSIQVTHRNVDRLYFRAWRYDLEERLRNRDLADHRPHRVRDSLLNKAEMDSVVEHEEPDATWEVHLPATPDYRSHITYVTPKMHEPGAYLVAASRRSDFARETGNEIVAVNLILTDLVLTTRRSKDGWEVSARSGSSGDPVAGVDLSLYCFRCERDLDFEVWRTGADGIVQIEGAGLEDPPYLLFGRSGQDIAFVEDLFLRREGPPEEAASSFVYTDRSIYRAGQTVHWKLVAYAGKESQYRTLSHRRTVIELLDSNQESVAADTVETNDFGSASGTFLIPEGRLLGQWIVNSALGGRRLIEVAEYKRPTFEVSIDDPQAPLRLDRPAVLAGSAQYYFGLPVTDGKVEWRMKRFLRSPRPIYVEPFDAGGSASLDRDGRFVIAFTPESDQRNAGIEGLTYRYTLEVDVTDAGGETRSAKRTFGVGSVAVSARIDSELGFIVEGEPGRLTVHRTDLVGVPRAGSGQWRLARLRQPEQTALPADQPMRSYPEQEVGYQTDGDRLRPRWDVEVAAQPTIAQWSEGKTVAAGEVVHAEDGSATIDLPELAAGAYRVSYETEDDFGEIFRTHHDLIVARRNGTPLSLPLVLLPERDTAPVGEVARVLVHSGLEDQELVLELYRDERIDRRVLRSGVSDEWIEIPITSADRGGIVIVVSALRDHQLMEAEQTLFVPWKDRELTIEFASFPDQIRPGAPERFRVSIRGNEERIIDSNTTELLAYMYDRSLDALAQHRVPDLRLLYQRRYGAGDRSSSLGSKHPVSIWRDDPRRTPFPALEDDQLRIVDGYRIGGPGVRRSHTSFSVEALKGGASAVAFRGGRAGEIDVDTTAPLQASPDPSASPASPMTGAPGEMRSDFSETAFFLPHVRVDESGGASVDLEVPDAVTEWNVWVHALTSDLAYGSARRTTRSAKKLMVRPYLPRFLREGDRVVLPVLVTNASDESLTGVLELSILDPVTEEDRGAEFRLAASTDTPSNSPAVAAVTQGGLQQTSVHSGIAQPFTIEPGGTEDLSFVIDVPPEIGSVAVNATARAGGFSDGEIRVLPVLPGRLHLAQSRFTALKDVVRRELRFEDLNRADSTVIHDQLVVTVDARLFHGVIQALPYLVDYPYESSEQLANRFLGSAIVTRLYDRYPAIARLAEQFSTRETEWEAWDASDPNQKVAWEEAPWLAQASGRRPGRGGHSFSDASRAGSLRSDARLIRLLDPDVARATRSDAIAKLRNLQSKDGGFPWRAGGQPSTHMTLYVLSALSKAVELGADVPKPMVKQAWSYLYDLYSRELTESVTRAIVESDSAASRAGGADAPGTAARKTRGATGGAESGASPKTGSVVSRGGGHLETIAFLNYVLSSYPDESWTGGHFPLEDRRRMLEHSFHHWQELSPLLKGYLALALTRAGRTRDAELVFDSVLDSARSDEDLGTYWAPEDQAWLWYNDTIETHAFALRVLTELQPDDPRRHGLVQWLFLNKKLDHWKSTRATAEVMYALAHYLQHEGTLTSPENVHVTAGRLTKGFAFDPGEYTGARSRLLVPGEAIDPSMGTIVIEKSTPGLAFASATWHFSTERLPEESPGDLFAVTRSYFRRSNVEGEMVLSPLQDEGMIQSGDQIEVHLAIRARHMAEYVHLRDPRPAGFEPESATSGYRWDLGLAYYEEIRDSGANFFFERLPAGEYTFQYRVRANLSGSFHASPATLQSLYAPEFVSYSAGQRVEISTSSPDAD